MWTDNALNKQDKANLLQNSFKNDSMNIYDVIGIKFCDASQIKNYMK